MHQIFSQYNGIDPILFIFRKDIFEALHNYQNNGTQITLFKFPVELSYMNV